MRSRKVGFLFTFIFLAGLSLCFARASFEYIRLYPQMMMKQRKLIITQN